MSIADLTKKPSEIRGNFLKVIAYGKSFTGKSFFLHNVKNMKVLVLDLEKGSSGMQDNPNVDILPINSVIDFKDKLSMIKEEVEAGTFPYDIVGIDSFTKYSEMLYVAIKKIYPEKKDAVNVWGMVDDKFREYYDLMLSLNVHIVILALEETFTTNDNEITLFPMLKARKFKEYMPSQADLCLHFTAKKAKVGEELETIRAIETNVSRKAFTKNRFESKIKFGTIEQSDKLFSIENMIKAIEKAYK